MSEASTISVGHTLSGRLATTQYRIEERLGAGGVGTVYRVVHLESGQSLALKVLHRSHAASDALRRRFEREALALTALSHPNVVRITDHGSFDDEPYLVMELLEGESLAERLKRARLDASEVRQLGRELLAALSYVHGEGLVHRDLKPGNVFLQRLTESVERCKVLDFGFVKFLETEAVQGDPLTRSGEIFGTPAYMAPEQMGGDKTSARTDVYALGVLLFEMVTGKRPFDGDVTDIMRGHLVEDPPRLESVAPGLVPCAGLAELVDRALAKRPADRFADASEMRAAFEALDDPLFRIGEPSPQAVLEQASTMVAAEAMPRPAPPIVPATRGVFARLAAAVRALVAGLVRAGAIALIVASLLVIAASALTIYGLRDAQGGPPSPRALAGKLDEGLRQTRQVLQGELPGVGSAQGTDGPAAPPASETPRGDEVGASSPGAPGAADVAAPAVDAVPPQAATAAAASGEGVAAEPDARGEAAAPVGEEPSLAAALPPARDPFRRAVPPELRKILRMANAGDRGGERVLARLRAYNRQHPRDARGHLLLARLYWNRGWREDVLNQYELALENDPSARGAAHLRDHLDELASQPKTAERATVLIQRLWGADALAGAGAQAR